MPPASPTNSMPTMPPASPMPSMAPKPSKPSKLPMILAFLLGAVLAGGGIYYWQSMQVSDLETKNQELTTQVSSLSAQVESLQGADPAVLATGAASQAGATSDVEVTCHVDTAKVTDLHVRFGTDGKTFESTEAVTDLATLGEEGTLADVLVTIPLESLTGDTSTYYYQCAGQIESATLPAGTAVFVKKK